MNMRERVAFDARNTTTDNYGNVTTGYTQQFIVAARVRPKFGGEQVTAARLAGRETVTITVRYSSSTATITPDWRARNARTGTVYNIRSAANPDERKQWIELLAESGVTI